MTVFFFSLLSSLFFCSVFQGTPSPSSCTIWQSLQNISTSVRRQAMEWESFLFACRAAGTSEHVHAAGLDRGVLDLVATSSKRFSKKFQQARGLIRRKGSSQPKIQTARRLVKKVFQQAKVATSLKTRRRKGCPSKQGCNQVEDSSSKRFSN